MSGPIDAGTWPLGRTLAESIVVPAGDRPSPRSQTNVVVIVLDDVGFAQLGCYGSDVGTPNLNQLADGGLRYTQFNVTSLCSPTRASLLTGRNHHAVGMGFVPDVPMRLPGYTGRIPSSAATVARHLRDAGYSTMAVGKWHLTPRHARTASGPFDLWPLGQGFERFYGFLHADTNQWTPNLVSDNHFVDPPARPEQGYHLTEDLVDNAIRMVLDQQHATPGKPFFLYLATGAMHAPHQVAPEWIDMYRGRFHTGWERWREQTFARQVQEGIVPTGTVCTSRPSWVQEWDRIPAEEQHLYARMQEVFAGFLSHTDRHIGRLLSTLNDAGLAHDTAVFLLSDNGASAEGGSVGSVNEGRFTLGLDNLKDNLVHMEELGGFRLFNHYPWGWAWAGNTPFRLWKRYAWLGGTRVPMIVRWPTGIRARGEIRAQWCHVVDLAPTVLDICGVTPAEEIDAVTQQPFDGRSVRATFEDETAAPPRQLQYFEMLGSRAIFADGWKATTNRVVRGIAEEETLVEGSGNLRSDAWELFHLDTDFSEAHDVSARHPDKLQQLQDLWWAEAGRNHVLPMGDWMDRAATDRASLATQPAHPAFTRKVFRPGAGPIADEAVPPLAFGGSVEADVEIPEDGGRGVIWAQGNWTGGWALYVRDGRLRYVLNSVGRESRLAAPQSLPTGRHRLTMNYERGSDGIGSLALMIDDEVVASTVLPPGTVMSISQADSGGLRIGHDTGFPVCDDYQPPARWTGTIHTVTVDPAVPASGNQETLARTAVHLD